MSLAEYLQKPNVERFLLCEITQGATVFYISDGIYRTESGDSIGAIPYTPIIGSGGLPSYRTSISDLLSPRASVSIGSLNLADESAMSTVSGASHDYRSLLDTLKRGATMVFKLAGPRSEFAYSEAITLFTATLRSIGGDDEGGLTLQTQAPARALFEAMTPTDRGVYGTVSNIPLLLTDYANQYYDTHPSGPITAVDDVYDDAVTLTLTTDYTVNTTTGVVTLVGAPAGDVTADVRGYTDSPVPDTIEEIAAVLVDSVISVGDFDSPTDTIGYFHAESEKLSDILDSFALSCGGFWFVDDAERLRMKLWDEAGTPATAYTQTQMLGYSFEMNDAIYDSQEVRYNKNWTVQQARGGATAGHADYVATQGDTTTQTDSGDGSDATDAPLIESYFTSSTPADAVATRVVNLMASKRNIYKTTVPLVVAHELGETITIETNEGDVDVVVIGRELIFDGGVPMQGITAYA